MYPYMQAVCYNTNFVKLRGSVRIHPLQSINQSRKNNSQLETSYPRGLDEAKGALRKLLGTAAQCQDHV